MEPSQLIGDVEVIKYSDETVKQLRLKTTVRLAQDSSRPKIFHCPTCQNPLLQYQGYIISITPGDLNDNPESLKIVKLPLIVRCRHSSDKWGPCHAIYIFDSWAI